MKDVMERTKRVTVGVESTYWGRIDRICKLIQGKGKEQSLRRTSDFCAVVYIQTLEANKHKKKKSHCKDQMINLVLCVT